VVDEVHQAGSNENSHVFEIDAEKRLGLSATPQRFGDPAGTGKIMEYFGAIVPPEISLQDAIEAGRLVPYEYHSHLVNLTADECTEWNNLTLRIGKALGSLEAFDPLPNDAKLLLIRRSRIAKKAQSKTPLSAQILKEEFSPGDRWLVYCEDIEQLRNVTCELTTLGLPVTEYHYQMAGDAELTLQWLERHGGILVSIRCLDEGVDIPNVDHALILASSQNPRQFIQRRGRVLRRAPGKHQATIHDVLVVPPTERDGSQQDALSKSELLRAWEFSKSALNPSARTDLEAAIIDLDIALDDLTQLGVEDDEQPGD
jgi:superfamily II DNA or RNA helicase